MPQLKIYAPGSEDPLKISTNSPNNYMRFNDNSDNRYAAVGYYRNCAFLSNEKANYARLAITDTGIPQYWSSNSNTTAKTLLHAGNYTDYTVTKTGSGANGTWGISITGNANSANFSSSASLLAIHNTLTTNSTRLIGPSSWNGAVSGLNYVWGQSFADTSISNDPGDLVLGLRPAQYSSGAELCMMIDGDYYSMGNKVLHAGNWSSYCAAKSHSHSYLPLSGGTMTGHLYAISELTWNHAHWLPNGNIYCQPTGNNQEWSFDVGASGYTGCYWHVWSAKNGCSMLSCYADDNSVHIPNGPFVVGSKCYGGSLPGASYYGQVFFLT